MKKNKQVKYHKSRFKYQLKRSKWLNGKRKRKGHIKIFNEPLIERIAPINFNLMPKNVENVLSYINLVKNIGKSGKGLKVNLSKVEDFGAGAISMLLSVMGQLYDDGIKIVAVKPKSIFANNILEQSGFMKYANGNIKSANLGTRNTIITGKKETSHTEILDAIHNTMKTVWNENGRSPLLYGLIVEMIKNSCKHAFKSDNNVRWHFGVNHDEKNKTTKFSFVDNGIGIVTSYKTGEFFKKASVFFQNNSEFIEGAFTNGIKSKTGLNWRGTGLPTIYEAFEDNIIKNFVVITNDAYCNFGTNEIIKAKNEFIGTYYYWEIDTTCVKHCFL